MENSSLQQVVMTSQLATSLDKVETSEDIVGFAPR